MKHAIALLCLTGMWFGIYAKADVLWVKFAPEDDCTGAIVAEFDKATATIDYQLFNFTSPTIADALIRAHGRGVRVRLLLDDGANEPPKAGKRYYSQAKRCAEAGLAVRLDRKHPISHNKVRIVDGGLLISGSFNDSRAANRNAENLYAEDSPAVVKRYADNFERHWQHAEAMP